MYYYSTESGRRLKISKRNATTEAWPKGTDIAELDKLGELANPTLTEDELTIVFSGNDLPGGRGGWDLWMAGRPDRNSPFGNVTNLRTLNTASWDMHASLAPDGSALYFMSNRNFTSSRTGRYQIFCAYRNAPDSQFGHVQHMALLDTADGSSQYPSISADGTSLYYCSQKDAGMSDIWVSRALPTYYVDAADGRNDNDGLSPRSALATIQKAINVAQDGDMIGVYPGTYREEVRFLGKAITVQSVADAAVIEAPEGFGVSFYMDEGPESVLRNFVIANSYVGILCMHSLPTITNVTVTRNVFGAEAYGLAYGEHRLESSHITNSIIWGNIESDLEGFADSYCCVGNGGAGVSAPSRLSSFAPDLVTDPCNFSNPSVGFVAPPDRSQQRSPVRGSRERRLPPAEQTRPVLARAQHLGARRREQPVHRCGGPRRRLLRRAQAQRQPAEYRRPRQHGLRRDERSSVRRRYQRRWRLRHEGLRAVHGSLAAANESDVIDGASPIVQQPVNSARAMSTRTSTWLPSLWQSEISNLRYQKSQMAHFARAGRQRMRLAASSPMNSSLAGSHFSGRFSSMAMLPRWQTVEDRWPTSTLAIGSWRLLMQSRKFWWWFLLSYRWISCGADRLGQPATPARSSGCRV